VASSQFIFPLESAGGTAPDQKAGQFWSLNGPLSCRHFVEVSRLDPDLVTRLLGEGAAACLLNAEALLFAHADVALSDDWIAAAEEPQGER
jgi:hypothetical protein